MDTSMHSVVAAEATGFLEEPELLKRVPVCRKTLYNLRIAGKIPSIKLGARNIYCWESVRTALMRLQTGGLEQ